MIELLIVIAIIALLAVLGIYNMSGGITKSKVSQTLAELSRFPTILATRGKLPDNDVWGNHYSFHKDGDTRYYYSWGPDKQDDGGWILYDPTNGTNSKGDIFIIP